MAKLTEEQEEFWDILKTPAKELNSNSGGEQFTFTMQYGYQVLKPEHNIIIFSDTTA